MDDQISSSTGGILHDDNGFEQVQHADVSPSAPPSAPPPSDQHHGSGVEDLYNPDQSDELSVPLLPEVKQTPVVHDLGPSVPATCPAKKQEGGTPSGCSGCCNFVKNVDPRVKDLLLWRDVKKSGVVFGSGFVLLISLALFSVVSVIAYLALVVLTITVSFRLYKSVLAAVQKTGEGHPFKSYLEMNIVISEDKAHKVADDFVKCLTNGAKELRRLFLVEEMVDTLKFGLLLWALTYIGGWFNGMTLVVIAFVGVFTLPKVYDTFQIQIDEKLKLVTTKLQVVCKQVHDQLEAKLPMLFKKKQN